MRGRPKGRAVLPSVRATPPRPFRCSRCKGNLHRPEEALFEAGDVLICRFCIGQMPREEFRELPGRPGRWVLP